METTQPTASKTNIWMIISIVLAVALIGALATKLPQTDNNGDQMTVLSTEQAGQELLSFLNEIYGPQLGTITLQSITEKNGLYEATIGLTDPQQGQAVSEVAFITKDGQLFIPQVINIQEGLNQFRSVQQQNLQTAPPGPVETSN
ncbi:MAG: hypothetical protein A3J62_01110 [Candidatus Buchananbacteria bacterium RIFCSPHIGHO2_02_FULL_38_8]|uniref:Uncharacterized protein n=2 Tax=Candidatus Buchananiibacteriota TaxID=1817903 RepID=A0A1G1XY86_9BACT|nr:MAG: hypothetical protein A2731_02305 [Candidatus Buchananbacteria bacterium RIFCSPHIGHO2_01_FULL_39_8]OGY47791.1 MAG: hypothetical protein A3J62_01110 [Candidatus Buchananbacteria bacterium RIFCSPHIGHO2_02_FULL_38_8]